MIIPTPESMSFLPEPETGCFWPLVNRFHDLFPDREPTMGESYALALASHALHAGQLVTMRALQGRLLISTIPASPNE